MGATTGRSGDDDGAAGTCTTDGYGRCAVSRGATPPKNVGRQFHGDGASHSSFCSAQAPITILTATATAQPSSSGVRDSHWPTCGGGGAVVSLSPKAFP